MEELPKEKLRLLFSDILQGFCFANYRDKKVKIKHLTHFDIADTDIKYNEYFEGAKRSGAPTIEDREKFLIEEGSWTTAKDKQINDNRLFVSNMKETKAKLYRQSEIDQLNKTIKDAEDKIKTLESEKAQLLQFTAESYANKKITEYQVFKSFILDDRPLFDEESSDLLMDRDIIEIVNLYNEKFSHFTERNFKRVALSNFFLNSFYLCKDNPFVFFGKPVVQLTMFQVDIFSHATYFKHILSNSPNKPPQNALNDPDVLIDWYQASKNFKEQTDKGKKPEDIVGLTQKDRDLLGLQSAHNPHDKMIAAAQKKGSPLSASEILKIQGVL